MKKFLILFVCIMLGASCTLDLRQDPNAVQPDQAIPNLVLNSMQRNLAVLFNTASTQQLVFARQLNSGGSLYQSIFTPQSFDGLWQSAYSNILQDAKQLTKQADDGGFARHAGISRVITAYTLMVLVDSFGDVPYSKANLGSDEFNPTVDQMADIYTEVHALLDKAKLDLSTPTVALGGYLNATAPVPNDLYYYSHLSGSYTPWIKLANTLKLKAFLSTRGSNAAAATTGINALIADVSATGGLMGTPGENFVFRHGISQSDPDSRHPRFTAGYPAGGGDYQSNWLMWHMFFGYDATHNAGTPGDPRMRFYFYRQVATNSTDPNQIRCATGTVPAHYPQAVGATVIPHPKAGMPPGISAVGTHPAWGRTWCYPTDRGYWGRDHVNNEGIPPDGLLRSQWGAYPAGGRFDANVNLGVSATIGMRGAGIQPLMMRSYVQFMLAESALYLGTTGTPATHFQNGIQFSFDDVRQWATTGSFAGLSGPASPNEAATISAFYPAANYTADVAAYIASANAAYAAAATADDKMNFVAREFWIAAHGNGIEGYNLYRRTGGMPTGMQPTLNAAPGAFPRSMWYPASFATLNSNVDQKTNLTGKIFWDVLSLNPITTQDLDF